MNEKKLGQELIDSIKEALVAKNKGKIVRPKLDILELRKKLKLSQKEFALAYHINLETLRKWEQGKRFPDTASIAYLVCIAKRPKTIEKILKDAA